MFDKRKVGKIVHTSMAKGNHAVAMSQQTSLALATHSGAETNRP
jgi:hypothetical protein